MANNDDDGRMEEDLTDQHVSMELEVSHLLAVSLLTSDPYTTLFCRNGMVSLQQALLSQRFSLLVAIDWFFAMKIVLWP